MASTADSALQLSNRDKDAVTDCKSSVDKAPLQASSDLVDLTGLDIVAQDFVNKFEPWKKFNSSRSAKVTALRFTKPARLTVPNEVLLIPTAITANSPTIGNQAVQLGTYFHLTEDVLVHPGFECLALLAE